MLPELLIFIASSPVGVGPSTTEKAKLHNLFQRSHTLKVCARARLPRSFSQWVARYRTVLGNPASRDEVDHSCTTMGKYSHPLGLNPRK